MLEGVILFHGNNRFFRRFVLEEDCLSWGIIKKRDNEG